MIRSLGANLLRDGAEHVANHCRHVVARAARTPHMLCVRPSGRVRLFERSKFPESEAKDLVGAYTKRTPAHVIAADCAEWLRERA